MELLGLIGAVVTVLVFILGWNATDGPKCVLCKKRKGFRNSIEWVKNYGMYSEKTVEYYYHPGCIHDVLCEPEKHSHKKVDLALGIVERAKQKQEKEEALRQYRFRADLKHKLKVKATCKALTDGDLRV